MSINNIHLILLVKCRISKIQNNSINIKQTAVRLSKHPDTNQTLLIVIVNADSLLMTVLKLQHIFNYLVPHGFCLS